jgi:hypothetical protein
VALEATPALGDGVVVAVPVLAALVKPGTPVTTMRPAMAVRESLQVSRVRAAHTAVVAVVRAVVAIPRLVQVRLVAPVQMAAATVELPHPIVAQEQVCSAQP